MKNKGRHRRKAAVPDTKAAPKAVVCDVCGVGDGKYKCPKCRAPFCCVQCSKDHKANQCPVIAGSPNKSSSEQAEAKKPFDATQKSQYLPSEQMENATIATRRKRDQDEIETDDDDPGFNITSEMKKRLEQSTWLRKELQDGGLRYLIGSIDAASDDETKHIKTYSGKKNSQIEGITPRVLALARSKSSHPKFASFIDQMLLTAGVLQPADGDNEGNLNLVPLPPRSAVGPVDNESGIESSSDEDDSSSSEKNDSSEGNGDSSEEEGQISDN